MMKLHHRLLAACVMTLLTIAVPASAQTRKDSVVLAMVLEPSPGLDPTTASERTCPERGAGFSPGGSGTKRFPNEGGRPCLCR